jgi:tetratricopeptide (TPR) repeat protein
MGKFARRNRGKLAVAALITGILIGGVVATSIGFVRASRERDRAQNINRFLMEMMSKTDPNIGNKDITVAEALTSSEPAIGKNFANDPRTEADVRSTIGWTLYHLGHYDDAVRHLRRAVELKRRTLGDTDVQTFDAVTRLVTSIRWQYRPAEALAIVEPEYRSAATTLGEEHPSTLALLDNYAGALDDLGRVAEAEPLYRKAIALNTKVLGSEADQTLSAMNNLAVVLIAEAQYPEAERVLRRVIEMRLRHPAEARVALLTNRHNLASIIASQGRLDESIREFESMIADARKQLGDDHSKTLSAQVSYADALVQAGRAEEALAINRDVLARRMRLLGPAHEQTMISQHNTINGMLATERFAEAEPASRALIAAADQYESPDHMLRLVARQDLAAALAGLRRFAEAEPLEREVIAAYVDRFGADHPRVLAQQNNLAMTLLDMGRVDDALAALRTVGQSLTRKPAPLIRSAYLRNLGRTLTRAGQFEEAERELLLANAESQSNPDASVRQKCAALLVELYTAWSKPADAQRWRATTRPTTARAAPGVVAHEHQPHQ